ncbi:MAG: methyltransferase domain-containing protein [Methanomicrobiales archaeon]|nr:methyltransferase domain-containing protein [Methanomicrobiales archaeon]
MRPRIAFARFLLRAGDFLRTLPVVVLRPADMIEWSRQGYERSGRYFATANDVDAGLTRDELELWERLPVHTGQVLILGVGGGREAVWFGQHGWHVTGLDFSGQMLEQARESMARRQFAFEGWIGDIARLEVQRESQDLVWTSMFLYSAVINRERRVKMLKLIYNALKPGGTLVISFHWQPNAQHASKYFMPRKWSRGLHSAIPVLRMGISSLVPSNFLMRLVPSRNCVKNFSQADSRCRIST